MKSKEKSSVYKSQIEIDNYLHQKKNNQNPLQDKYPRWKNHHSCSLNKSQRIEVKIILLPWIMDFVKTRLQWKKMPKFYPNDSRIILTQHFVGGQSKSKVWKGGQETKKKIWYKPSIVGKSIMDIIKTEQPEFTENEILNTLISIIYKNRVDYLSIKLKPFKNTRPVKEEAISLWDKISEKVQV